MEDELLCRGIGSVGLNWKVITKEWLNNSKSGKECKSRWENALRTKMALRAQAAECKNDICSTHHHPYLSSPYFLPNYTLSPPCNNNNYHGRQGKSLNQTNNDQGRIATSSSSSSSSWCYCYTPTVNGKYEMHRCDDGEKGQKMCGGGRDLRDYCE
mmetsp:Transcript_5234/g.7624  ORF Transcript_5234/g.7624 Transcript_5234/m.7624 type:complete len:156 (-) Transcript_5234:265-732(-)